MNKNDIDSIYIDVRKANSVVFVKADLQQHALLPPPPMQPKSERQEAKQKQLNNNK